MAESRTRKRTEPRASIGTVGFDRLRQKALAEKATRLTGIPEDSLIEARRQRRKEIPAGRGKHTCGRCGFKIRRSITQHEAGLHHQLGASGTKGKASIMPSRY